MAPLLLAVALFLPATVFCRAEHSIQKSAAEESKSGSRQKRILSPFQIITFPNLPCSGSLNSRNGTCFTLLECETRGGEEDGSCALGFGVCCTFLAEGCGFTFNDNCTYFEEVNAHEGACDLTICPCSNNICQLRLDFERFDIAGPSTVSVAEFRVLNGQTTAATNTQGRNANTNTQCLTDTFTVTSPGNPSPPVICGLNTEAHMYVDASPTCNQLAFQIGPHSTTASRSWSIKVTQYSCNHPNLAPDGCTQYYFGFATHEVESFNFLGGHHLANQDQSICVRCSKRFSQPF